LSVKSSVGEVIVGEVIFGKVIQTRRGSIKYVHFKCLKVWMQTIREEFCRICRTRYDIYYMRKGKSFWKYLITNKSNTESVSYLHFCSVRFAFLCRLSHSSTSNHNAISIADKPFSTEQCLDLLIQSWVCFLNSFKEFTQYMTLFESADLSVGCLKSNGSQMNVSGNR
jgi:hypothetical protein